MLLNAPWCWAGSHNSDNSQTICSEESVMAKVRASPAPAGLGAGRLLRGNMGGRAVAHAAGVVGSVLWPPAQPAAFSAALKGDFIWKMRKLGLRHWRAAAEGLAG